MWWEEPWATALTTYWPFSWLPSQANVLRPFLLTHQLTDTVANFRQILKILTNSKAFVFKPFFMTHKPPYDKWPVRPHSFQTYCLGSVQKTTFCDFCAQRVTCGCWWAVSWMAEDRPCGILLCWGTGVWVALESTHCWAQSDSPRDAVFPTPTPPLPSAPARPLLSSCDFHQAAKRRPECLKISYMAVMVCPSRVHLLG